MVQTLENTKRRGSQRKLLSQADRAPPPHADLWALTFSLAAAPRYGSRLLLAYTILSCCPCAQPPAANPVHRSMQCHRAAHKDGGRKLCTGSATGGLAQRKDARTPPTERGLGRHGVGFWVLVYNDG